MPESRLHLCKSYYVISHVALHINNAGCSQLLFWRQFSLIICPSSLPLKMSAVQEVVEKFNAADQAIKKIFPKVDPRLVVSLIFDRNAGDEKRLYTLDIILKPGQNTDAVRQDVVNRTGFAPGFYLSGTKMIVSHPLDIEFLKWINDHEGIERIKGSPYSAGGSTDF